MSILTSLQVGMFLKDFEKHATVEIIEGAKETSEIVKIAKAKGIDLKNNRDLSGFKAIYGFADKPNYNLDMVPEPELLKSLPSIISKPINIAHERRYVIGHIIDYRYQQKDKKIIVYGVIYKSNFGTEWKRAKREFKDGNLGVSWEIHSPDDKRVRLPNGVFELNDIEHAGMALLFKDDEDPAAKGATVLSMARKQMDEVKDLDLVYASKYKDSDIITASSDIYKEEVEKNLKELNEKEKSEVVEPKAVIKENKEEKTIEAPKEPEIITNPKIKCSNCEEEFEILAGQLEYKCPKCFSILDTKGIVKYPPQLKDFRLACPNCGLNNWLILKNEENKTTLKCQNEVCNKNYEIEFAQEVKNELLDKTRFLYTNTISCIQCGNSINISGTSQAKVMEVKCPKCKLTFNYNVTRANKDRQITKITEIEIEEKKSEEQGGDEEVKIPKEIVEKVKEEEKKVEKKVEEKVVGKPKEEITPKAEENKVEAPKEEIKPEVKASKEIIPEKSSEVKTFVDLVREENELREAERGKGKGKNGKPQGDGGADICVCSKCGYKVSHKKGEPCNETKCPKCKTALVGKTKKAEKTKTKPKKSAVRKAVKKIMDLKKDLRTAKTEKEEKENTLKIAIKKVASQLILARAEVKKIKKEADEKIKFIEENAKTILKRQEELGDYAKDLSDKDILNNDKFKLAKLEKENTLLKASKEESDEIIGDKTDEDLNSEDMKLAKEIDAKAFTKKEEK